MSAYAETFRGVAHPWLCDAMGHMNTRHHCGMFDDALMHFLAMLGYRFSWVQERQEGWVDVQLDMSLHAEVRAGSLLRIASAVEKVGNSSLTVQHRMTDAETDILLATMRSVTVYLDLKTRRSRPLPAAIREAAGIHRVTESQGDGA